MSVTFHKLESNPEDPCLNEIVGSWTYKPTEKRVRERIERHIDEQNLYSAEEDGQLIGALAFRKLENGITEITGLGVLKEKRGQGKGRSILQMAERRLFTSAEIVVETDDSAFQFYRKCGFSTERTETLNRDITRYTLRKDRLPANPAETDRLTLRMVEESDAEAVFRIYSSEEVCRHYDIEPYTKKDQAAKHIGRWLKFFREGKQIRYTINLMDQVIGTCGLYLINQSHNRACLGYDLLPEYQGHGYAREAVSAMVEETARYYRLRRIQAEVLPGNTASIRLLEMIGFSEEGLFRQYEKWGDKGYVDLLIFSRIFETI